MKDNTPLNCLEKTAYPIPTLQQLALLIAAATEHPLSITPEKAAAIHAVSLFMADHLAGANPPPNPA